MNPSPLKILGIGVSPGISIGRVHVMKKKLAVTAGVVLSEEEKIPEIKKFDEAVTDAVQEVMGIVENNKAGLKVQDVQILEAQIELLSDPQIREDVIRKIQDDGMSANDALIEVIKEVVEVFSNMNDEYMSARAADVQDVGARILKKLNGTDDEELGMLASGTILIADELLPSDTLSLNLDLIAGFATINGGMTSHTAIIAKSRGMPAIVGCGEALKNVGNDDEVILDGAEGLLVVHPHQSDIDKYQVKRKQLLERKVFLNSLVAQPAITTDGVTIKLMANISSPEDLVPAFSNGAAGCGLFRTELLFMERSAFPSEDEQFEFYKKAAVLAGDKPVIVRTIDIGGDKDLSYFKFEKEANPFLGYRAIRICLDRKDIFITQLKAILRAGVFGNLKIMFPMISGVEELRAAKKILQQVKEELGDAGVAYDAHVKTGVMIEIPSAAVTADILAREADFFSIGTNDLCQYTLAVDRMNEKIKDLYEPFHPGVLRLIANVIDQGHHNKIEVAMCGELASDPMATLLLMGMGLEEFSMSAASIPQVKNIILNNSLQFAKEVCKKVMEMDNAQNIKTYLKEVSS